MGYSRHDYMVRVDFHKPSGKWSFTKAVDMSAVYSQPLIHDALSIAIREHFRKLGRNADYIIGIREDYMAVCAEPYHEHAHPIILMPGRWPES